MEVKVRRSKLSFGDMNVFVRVLIASAVMLVTVALSSLPVGLVIGMCDDPLSLIDIGSLITLLIGGATASLIIAKISPDKKFLTVSLSALLFSLIMTLVGLVATGGEVGARVFLNYLCYIGVSLLFGRIGMLEPKRRR